MENVNTFTKANGFEFAHIGWKYYHNIKKKAMEQEFSWTGLILSLSIAFFIVIATSVTLGWLYNSIIEVNLADKFGPVKIYRLEGAGSHKIEKYLQTELFSETKMKAIRSLNLV